MPIVLGRRWTLRVLIGAMLPLLVPLALGNGATAAATMGADEPGPAMLTSSIDRVNALSCYGDPEYAARPPVLLVPGTSVTPLENWDPSYLPVLLERGHAVCLVWLPALGTKDVQANVEYVATAIRTLAGWSSRRMSIIGHSQGALLPLVALRTWPDLAAHVDDVVGVAGVYDHGSADIARTCATRCLPALHQVAAGSAFLDHIGRRPLPPGPSYTNIGTRDDQTITPQPAANEQPGTTSIIVESVCPGRTIPAPEHAMIIGDAVALSLVVDALDHPGAADEQRFDQATCAEQHYPEFDAARFLGAAGSPSPGMAAPVAEEPPLYCRVTADCRSPRLRGYLIARTSYAVGRKRVTVGIIAQLPGRLRVTLGDRTVTLSVRPGPVVLQLRRPAERKRLRIKTRPLYYTAWATEAGRSVPGRR